MSNIIYKTAICLFFLLCTVWFGKLHFYRDPGSVFFDKERAYETRYSTYRREETQETIQFYSDRQDTVPHGTPSYNRSLCVALSSVKRQTQYVQITIGSMLHGLSPQERADLYISVLIAETDPTRHPIWHEGWLRRAVDNVHNYNISAQERAYLQELEEAGRYSEKGVFDYVYALQECYDTGSPYIGMFEDDIILAHGWFIKTMQGLRGLSERYKGHQTWLFMRLFNQERSTGWASHDIGGNNEHWIILGVDIAISILVLLARKRNRAAHQYFDLGTLFVTATILIPGLVILFYQSGKASLLPPSPGVHEEPFGCCSQAMIFPREQVPLVVRSLREKREGQVDLMLNDIASNHRLDRYALYPVQAQHIGIDSARQTVREEAQAIWSMAFEDLKPHSLEKEHQQMVNKYYRMRQDI